MTQRIKRVVAVRRYAGKHRTDAGFTGILDRITDSLARIFRINTQQAA